MPQTHLRLGDQAHVARLVGERSTALTQALRTLEQDLDAHAAGFTGAGGAAFRAALAAWLHAAGEIPRSIGRYADRLDSADTSMAAAQADQAATFDRVARSLAGPA